MMEVESPQELDAEILKYHVLLVEDNDMDVAVVRRSFQKDETSPINGSIELSVAGCLREAIELLAKNSYDAILLDLGLPEGVGIEILHKVTALNLHVPIIILTGNEDKELGFEALRSGADDYLRKSAISEETLPRSVRYSIERSQRLRAERKWQQAHIEILAAETIQQRLLPQSFPQIRGIEISGACLPAEKVGGDLFDFLTSDESSCTGVIADVSGHGLPAAILMTELHGLLHGLVEQKMSLPRLMAAANYRTDQATEPHQFITMLSYHFSVTQRAFSYISAGHPGWILKSNGKVVKLKSQYLPLGIRISKEQMTLSTSKIDEGDIILLPTDGIFEMIGEDSHRFGVPRMIELVQTLRDLSADEIVQSVLNEAMNFSLDNKPVDDCTLVVIKVISLDHERV
ncbi:SpoIIE family protein phosphatase [Thalassoglobus sp.]|uniref:SpoIIE family protein phosphatase n=1 Tax=Thalassoglobus sp. TaxID=2795869 RepID=UPI003AA96AB5